MADSIDWKKQYELLENQMRKMMQMSLKLMTDKSITKIKKLLIEKVDDLMFVTAIAEGENTVYKFKGLGSNSEKLFTTDYSYRNSFEISNIEDIERIIVYAKEEKASYEKSGTQSYIDLIDI